MKSLTAVLFLLLAIEVCAQDDKHADTYVCKTGKVHFFSSSPLEDIEATTNTAICVINIQTKKVNAVIKQTSFVFKDKLMEEHFNENYMESNQYPNGTLDMVIVEDVDFSVDSTYDITLRGTLEMHGVKQTRDIKGKLTVKNGVPVSATAVFDVKLADHKIKIPKAVVMNIAEVIKVDAYFVFEKYQKK